MQQLIFTVNTQNHILSVLVENKTGVLNRVLSLFRRRRFNVESLTVSPSEQSGLSRIIIVVHHQANIAQVMKQMDKLIEVIRVRQLDPNMAIVRDFALVTFKVSPRGNMRLTAFLKKYRTAKVLKKEMASWVVQIVDMPDAVQLFLIEGSKHGLLHITRTGATATDAYLPHA